MPPVPKKFNSSASGISSNDGTSYDPFEEENLQQDYGDALDVSQILAELQKQQAKKSSARAAAFQNQKQALYEKTRRQMTEIVREGSDRLEAIKGTIADLKKHELSYEDQAVQLAPLLDAQNEKTQQLLALYPPMFDHFFPQRAQITNEASAMVRSLAPEREASVNRALTRAAKQVEKSRMDRKIAADASQLIKKHKALLHS